MSEQESGPAPGQEEGTPNEEEIRAALEEQMRSANVGDLVVQSVVGLVNLTARRIGIAEERDLDQARLGIDAVRALVDLLPAEVASQVRDALSQLQMQYAQISGEGQSPTGEQEQTPADEAPNRPESPGDSRLWTPPGS